TMYATFHFMDGKIINWDGKSRNNYPTYGSGRGTIIYGTEGSVYVDRGGYKLYDRTGKLVRERSGNDDEQGTALGGGGSMTTRHLVNFYNGIRGVTINYHDPSVGSCRMWRSEAAGSGNNG
ncbi:MAG: hypothetical protein P8X57_13200, partial [Cyclobacteriaceae bacterium]